MAHRLTLNIFRPGCPGSDKNPLILNSPAARTTGLLASAIARLGGAEGFGAVSDLDASGIFQPGPFSVSQSFKIKEPFIVTVPQDSRGQIDQIADETLKQFDRVAVAARNLLGQAPGPTVDAMAGINTFTDSNAVNRLAQISGELRQSYKLLAAEPAISRVVVEDDDGKLHTYFICRTTPILGMASYRSPIGRLASLPVGSALALPKGGVQVLESARLHPEAKATGWDSVNSVVEGHNYGPITVASFHALLESGAVDVGGDILDSLLAQESESANLIDGIRRSVITKMGLRDQPILDQYQDEIFRLPLSSRLLILGPPGTGKTTTLIRRLGQKLDTEFLDGDERSTVEALGVDSPPHNQSWLMFTPTELLKQYVKEAFNRENIPAPEARIRTWSDYSRELGRRVLGILRTASTNGTFVLKSSVVSITAEAQEKMPAWFGDFAGWHKSVFVDEIRLAAEELSKDPDRNTAELGQRLLAIIQRSKTDSIPTLFTAINSESNRVQSMIADRKAVTDRKIRESLTQQLNRNKDFLSELASFIDGLQEASIAEGDEADDADIEDEDEVNQPKTPVAKAMATYNQAVRSQARSVARKRSLSKNTRTGKILEWIGDRTLADVDRAAVGASLLVQARARRFVNSVKKYIDGTPRRYRAFRRLRQSESKWYSKEGFSPTDLHPLELDIVILAMLRSSGELLNVASITRNIDTPAWSTLKPIRDLYKNQILLDEATDFSPVQIACMAALAHPRLLSFFACGDFNQRLTTWGSRSVDDIKWTFPKIEIKEIKVFYRQSRQLNEFSNALIRAVGGTDSGVTLPEHVNTEGVPPVLAEGMADHMKTVNWLAARIQEIESTLQQLPSIAILVNNEEEVQRVAETLDVALTDLNIRAVACPNGQVMGQGNDVRVFDVQHIKGLEFEAVFFVGIDRLAMMHPDLFDKYLYVGSTRAATYLGVTCDVALPAAIIAVRPMFLESW